MNKSKILEKLAKLEKRHAAAEVKRQAEAVAEGYTFHPRKFDAGIPYRPKLEIFKSSTGKNTFNPETFEAHSYNHWCYVRRIKGKVVFNAYRYSMTTNGHQSEMRTLLRNLGIKIDLEVNTRSGLHAFESAALVPMYEELSTLEIEMKRKGAKPESNKVRAKRIKQLKADIALARKLGAKIPKATIQSIRKDAVETEAERLETLKREREQRRAIEQATRKLETLGTAVNQF